MRQHWASPGFVAMQGNQRYNVIEQVHVLVHMYMHVQAQAQVQVRVGVARTT